MKTLNKLIKPARMSFMPQHRIRCYCNKKECYHQQNLNTKNKQTKSKSITSNKNDTSNKFIKIKHRNPSSSSTCSKHGFNHSNTNKHGLGHSDTNTTCYSRRNSNATLTSESTISSKSRHDCNNYNRRASLTSTISSNMLSQDEPVHSSVWSRHSPLEEHEDDFTEQRRCYERYKIPYESKSRWEQPQERPQEIILVGKLKSTQPTQIDDSFIRELQRFRLANADDCFNVHRQNDLKMQNLLGASLAKQPGSPVSSYSNSLDPPLVPWSDAMKKLRSTLEESGSLLKRTPKQTEDDARKVNRKYFNKLQGPLSKSYALRFQSC